MERWVEGNRQQRMKLDSGPWNQNKILRKVSKQFLWIIFSMWTGFTFVGFFTPIRELASGILNLSLGPWETFWAIFYGFATMEMQVSCDRCASICVPMHASKAQCLTRTP
jgi:polyferredoxin